METPSPAIRQLARQLLACEAASQSAPDSEVPEASRLLEKLRISVTRFAGPDGFVALARRALSLARAEAPALASVQIAADGRLQHSEVIVPDAALALSARLLGLLVTFIGHSLTLRLIHDAWPDAPLDE